MFFLYFLSCQTSSERNPLPLESDADVYTDLLGESVSWIDASLKEKYSLGQEVMNHAFSSGEGLGPTFNADSCASCHQKPVATSVPIQMMAIHQRSPLALKNQTL